MLKIRYEKSFKKDFKRIVKRGYNTQLLETIINLLANEEQLPLKHRDHNLVGDFNGFRECHITPDWLLVYRIEKEELVLVITRTGTHSDLFR